MRWFAMVVMGLGLLACGENPENEECAAIVVCCAYSCLSQAEIDGLEADNCDCQMDPPPPSEQCLNVEGECVFVE